MNTVVHWFLTGSLETPRVLSENSEVSRRRFKSVFFYKPLCHNKRSSSDSCVSSGQVLWVGKIGKLG